MDFEEIHGNIFTKSSQTTSFAHCVSEDLALGKGIALDFRRRYGGIQSMRDQHKGIGEVAIIEIHPGRYVFNLITKYRYWMKPTLDTLKSALVNLRLECERKKVKELSIPQIGCGLDRLHLEDVKNIIKEVFNGSQIQIKMFFI